MTEGTGNLREEDFESKSPSRTHPKTIGEDKAWILQTIFPQPIKK